MWGCHILIGDYCERYCFTYSSDLSSVEFSDFSVFNEHLHYLPSHVQYPTFFCWEGHRVRVHFNYWNFSTSEVWRHQHLCDVEYALDVTTL